AHPYSSPKIAVPRLPSGRTQPRYIPAVLNGRAMLPCPSSAMTPPSPPCAGITSITTLPAASARLSPRYAIRAQMSCATALRMKNSPQPRAHLRDHLACPTRRAVAAKRLPRADVVRPRIADEELPPARRRHPAVGVRPGPGPDDRRIAHPAPHLAGHPAGRGRRRDPPLRIQRHRTHGAEVLPGRLRPSGLAVASLALPGALELLAPRVRIKPLVRHPFQVRVPVRETLGAFAHQHHVRRLL